MLYYPNYKDGREERNPEGSFEANNQNLKKIRNCKN